jgi:hypothetical protein
LQLFLLIYLIQKWVQYTKIWVTWLKGNEVVDSWKRPMSPSSKLRAWEGPSIAEVYILLGILICMGTYKEITISKPLEYLSTRCSTPRALFYQVRVSLAISASSSAPSSFDHTKIDETAPLPKAFQAADK